MATNNSILLEKAVMDFNSYLKSKERSVATLNSYNIVLKDFKIYIEKEMNGQVYLHELTGNQIEKYLQYRKEHGDQPVSRNLSLSVLRSFFTFLVRKEMVEKNITLNIEPVQVQQKERVSLNAEEIAQLIPAIDQDIVRVAAITMVNTGLRVAELCNLTLKDVNLEHDVIQVRQGKGNKDRSIPINDHLKKELTRYLNDIRPYVESDRFFANSRTGKLSRQCINEELKEAVQKLGWSKHVTAHILRHSFASALVRNNASLPAVQKLMGHSDLRVTSRYIHQNMDQLKQAVSLI